MDKTPLQVSCWGGKFLRWTQSGTPSTIIYTRQSSGRYQHGCDAPLALARYVRFRVPHSTGTFSPPSRISDPDMQHSTCVMHVPWYMPWLLNSGFLRCRWRGKHSRQSRRMHNLQLYVSGKRPIEQVGWIIPSLSQSLSCMQRVQVDARCKYIIAFSRIYSRRNSYMYIWVYV